MLIDDDIYRWTQIGIVVMPPAALLLRAFFRRRFKLGIGIAFVAFVVLAVGASIFTVSLATQALRADPGNRFTPAVVVGTARYHFDNGSDITLTAAGRQATVVINNTDQPLAVMPVAYAVGGFGPPASRPERVVAPFSAATSPHDIAYYGQAEHAPPHTIQANAPQTTRYWLTELPH